MNRDVYRLDPSFDPRVVDWLEGDPRTAPTHVLDTILAALPSVAQRHGPARSPLRWSRTGATRAAAALAVFATVWSVIVLNAPSVAVRSGSPIVLHPSVSTKWPADDSIVMTITRDPLIDEPFYWRVATYDQLRRNGWEQGDPRVVDRPAQTSLVAGTFDDPGPRLAFRSARFQVTPSVPGSSLLASPSTPVRVSEAVRLTLIGEAGFFGAIRAEGKTSGGYEVMARVPVFGGGDGELNAAALRAAGTEYPSAVTDRYLGVPDGIFGPSATALMATIERRATSQAPIDLVQAALTELRSNSYAYETDLTDLDCDALSTVECLARYRKGFCQYYATTMAAVLRAMGVPARLAEGFLPGQRDGSTQIIRATDAHAWVEVYFPSYGWVPFDPTPLDQGPVPVALPPGIDGS